MIDDKQTYENILKRWLSDWARLGNPSETALPTMNTFILNQSASQQDTVLNGQLKNIQPILETLLTGQEVRQLQAENHTKPSVLEIACGYTDADQSDVLMARVASYTSEQTGDEANATALTCYLYFLTPSDDQTSIFTVKQNTEENFAKIRECLVNSIGEDAEYYLTRYFSFSLKSFHIKNGDKPEIPLGCVNFWFEYGDWREKISTAG